MADKLKRYSYQRRICLNDLNTLLNLSTSALETPSKKSLFRIRYSELDDVLESFNKFHQNIVMALLGSENNDVKLTEEEVVRDQFMQDYYQIKTNFFKIFEEESDNVTTNAHNVTQFSENCSVRLPKLELIKFSGDFTSAVSFFDLFHSLVHTKTYLNKTEKLSYLIHNLEGPPLRLAKSLPLASDNYERIYDKLKSRYLNKRLRAMAHWSKIENAPSTLAKNAESLNNLIDIFSENVAALVSLGFPVSDFILAYKLLTKLDEDTKQRFELQHCSSEMPTYQQLSDFLENLGISLNSSSFPMSGPPESIKKVKSGANSDVYKKITSKGNKHYSLFSNTQTTECFLCKDYHFLQSCPSFLSKPPYERYNLCKRMRLCFKCLTKHSSKACGSKDDCRYCGRPHHNLLHFKSNEGQTCSNSIGSATLDSGTAASISSPSKDLVASNFVSLNSVVPKFTSVLLSTVLIEILDGTGVYQPVRAVLDGGSMASFISKTCLKRLNLPHSSSGTSIRGIGAVESRVLGSVALLVKPMGQKSPILTCEMLVLPKICETLPVDAVNVEDWTHISNLKLADPGFHNPGRVDLLLGADIFAQTLLDGKIPGKAGVPDAINTIFGYILMGRYSPNSNSTLTSLFCDSNDCLGSLDKSMQQFWTVESVPEVNCLSPDDAWCERHFLDTVSRDKSGRYMVSLPFKEPDPTFPGMYELAASSFLSLERRLLRKPSLYQEYCDFMRDYLESNHMEPVLQSEKFTESCCYIPHHAVLKPESMSTKLRVVFNASAKVGIRPSLNDLLLPGRKLQQDILSILLSFRLHVYAFSTDIKQMYRQILVAKKDCDYQRIVWRFSASEPLQEFRLLTVTYGLTSAPYLALRTLLKLAEDEGHEFPLAKHVLLNTTYIDDVIGGSNTLEGARELQQELIVLLSKGRFELRKWSSHELKLLEGLPESHISRKPISFDESNEPNVSLKILGLIWNPTSDCFSFVVKPSEKPCNKRSMLSELARVFDPVGFLAPVTFYVKHLIQRLWLSGVGWDDTPSKEICQIWTDFKTQLPLLSELNIPRLMMYPGSERCELHGFCDSSERGYAAVIFLRFLFENELPRIFFVCAKSKVSPTRTVSLPRLELCGAVLLAKLISHISKSSFTSIKIDHIFAWTDSEIVLGWIKSSPHRWKTFVSNRVAYIQERVSPDCWYHVPSASNPADLASRGVLPALFLNLTTWFSGPSFLSETTPFQVSNNFDVPGIYEEERKIVLQSIVTDNTLEVLLQNHSDFSLIRRILAWILRFIRNSRVPGDKRLSVLSSDELYEAFLILIRHTQHVHFEKEFEQKEFSKGFRKLNSFIDEKGLLRVGGRLSYLPASTDKKFPCILPPHSRLTVLLIEHYHKKYFHAGSRTVHFLLAQHVWILSPKRAIRSVLSKCLNCWKQHPKPYQPMMGNLPLPRISQTKPFLHSGVDFGGPFFVVMNRARGAKSVKAYLCLFVCMATKALHLELATDLSSEAFLLALQRFIARRGRVTHLYSDRGTNFIGASHYLKHMKNAASKENICFHFNVASAPHFGGLWEAGIKSVKTHLARVVGEQILSFEELYTVIVQIESYLNSRPLTSMSSDPNDFSILTPGHFLNLEPLSAVFEPVEPHPIPLSHLKRWRLLNNLHKSFWERWSKEYLHTLHQRSKWSSSDSLDPPKLGTLVLILDQNLPPSQWRLGRLSKLFPGEDGIVRVAEVTTSKGSLRRPLVKLCPLPSV